LQTELTYVPAGQSAFSLVELLVVLAITATLISAGGKLFSDGWAATHRAIARAESDQMVMILMKRWQAELGNTTPAEWKIENTVFIAGQQSIAIDGRHLAFTGSRGTIKARLPDGAECSFNIERNGTLADCAVLNLAIRRPSRRIAPIEQIRIVSCGKKP
jgi:prepilin-type N-terminal cleavage/methylation domain-containing protein